MHNTILEWSITIFYFLLSTGVLGYALTAVRKINRNKNLDFLLKVALIIVNGLNDEDEDAKKAKAVADVNKALADNKLTKRFPADRVKQVVDMAINQSKNNGND